MKILMAVDGSAHSRKTIAYVKEHMNIFGKESSVTVINVQMALPPHVAGHFSKANIDTYYQDTFEKQMKPVRRALTAAGMQCAEALKVGHPGDEIADLAKRGKFDLVVMGSHGHGLFRNLVLGSVAQRLIALAKQPVVLVK